MRILSLGAGVQSSTLALMMAQGEIEPADHAIFADTQWEPKAVYDWLDYLIPLLPFPVHKITAGSLRQAVIESKNIGGTNFSTVPWHISPSGMGRRQCTREYKIDPLRRKMRELIGSRKRSSKVEVLIGISTDEAHRMKPSRNQWQIHSWPLIDAGISRTDCLVWMSKNGYPRPPKSSCLGCPYHSDLQWSEIKAVADEWEDVVSIDKLIRNQGRGMKNQQFMHRKKIPLDEVQLIKDRQADLFGNECEGICGI